ncbi:hypothetical protein RIF29_00168 [Crotalaria pallida]|uniref:Uncharacterized protein n=1 Tax=Crotalaria pallida TaxID=3830 RepID=A0AAN9IVE6_CROPI
MYAHSCPTSYTKALEVIKKLHKDQAREMKTYKFKLENLQTLKDASYKFIKNLNALLLLRTYFSEAIAGGVLCENYEHVAELSELIKLAFVLKCKDEEIEFLMESKNLQIFCEDEEFLSSAFSSN